MDQIDEDIFWGDWHAVDSGAFASAAVPASFPAGLLAWAGGSGDVVAELVMALFGGLLLRRHLRRHADGAWAAVILKDRSLRFPRVVARIEFADRAAAVAHAERVDEHLKQGLLPEGL